jgi:hypothetical protein
LIRQIAVAVPPKQGMASVESSHWSYQSKPGFTGTDEFVLLIAGQTISNPATLTVNVTVGD